jgi:ABC-type molybdenum transport system ATPase subunit/photorepair protein PhrA
VPRRRPRAAPATVGPARRAAAPTLIRLRSVDLYVEYRPVLRSLDWELRQGEHWAVFGGNGAGKSSFLRLLYGDLSPALGGRIERRGFPRGAPIAAWKRHVGLVSPELQTDYAVDVSLLDLVASGRHASIGLVAPATAADRRAALLWLDFFGLRACATRRPRELSYGQLRRALFARALAAKPRILLLDEPLTGLDPRQRSMLKGFLARLMSRGVTLVMAVHHPEDLPAGRFLGLALHKGTAHRVEV